MARHAERWLLSCYVSKLGYLNCSDAWLQVSFRRLTLASTVPHWQRAFGKLPLTQVLNVTQWDDFQPRANEAKTAAMGRQNRHGFAPEVMSLFRLVEHNATDAKA